MKRRAWLLAALALAACVDLSPPPELSHPPLTGNDAADSEQPDAGAVESDDALPPQTTPDAAPEIDAAPAIDVGSPPAIDAASPPDLLAPDAPLATAGTRCTAASQCQSGFCADGVCCGSGCTEACHSCNIVGSVGSCVPVPAGQDLRDECPQDPPASCGHDGTCDGVGACRLYLAGVECAPGGCSGSTESAARVCDGHGTCGAASTRPCPAGNTCSGSSCGAACTSTADCQTGFFCDAGACRAKRALAQPCTAASQCASGFCADGVCCSSACGTACRACNVPGAVGTCTDEPSGSDVRNDCPAQPASSCGRAGACDGKGACLLWPAGTTCGAASCTGSTETTASSCNGRGSCLAGASADCGGYLCSGSACATSCTNDALCKVPSYVCSGGACRGPVLVIDDFADTKATTNNLGGEVTWDNQNCSLVSGQMVCAWSGVRDFQDFIETFRPTWCEYDVRAYSKLRFRMKASTAGKLVDVFIGIGNGTCTQQPAVLLTTVTLTTGMTIYEASITGVAGDKALLIEFDPRSLDTTQYTLDDLQLVP